MLEITLAGLLELTEDYYEMYISTEQNKSQLKMDSYIFILLSETILEIGIDLLSSPIWSRHKIKSSTVTLVGRGGDSKDSNGTLKYQKIKVNRSYHKVDPS